MEGCFKNGGKNQMSAATTQADLGIYNNTQDILSLVVKFIEENKKWRGTASELTKVLGLGWNPRALSLQLKNLKAQFENYGISITWDRKRDKRIIIISNNAEVSHSEVTLRHTTSHTSQDNSFASHIQKQAIEFPWEWKYGRIEELSEREKNEFNQIQKNSRKHYRKPCSLCGEEGVIEYRKVSDGNPSLICKRCAEKYVESAKRIMLKNKEVGVI